MFSIRCWCAVLLASIASFAQAPSIDSVNPSQGPIAGGTEVSVRGTNLSGAQISVDSDPVPTTLASNSEVRFLTPKHDNGYAIIRLTASGSTIATRFFYIPPRLQDLAPGYITTIAGVGNYFGDYGSAREAALGPFEIVYARDGSLYVAEPTHDRVVRITPEGILEPFAGTGSPPSAGTPVGHGGPATQAALSFPRSLLIEHNGDVVIADGGQNLIWRVAAQSGIIRIIAGTGQAGFLGDGGPAAAALLNSVSHLTGDGDGTIWFIDYRNFRIRQVTPDGKIATICGTGTPGYSGDGGPAALAQFDTFTDDDGALAYDPAGFLYLADHANRRIRRIDLATGIIDTFIGPNRNYGADLSRIKSLLVAPGGDLYFHATAEILHVTRSGQLIERFGAPSVTPTFDGTPLDKVRLSSVPGMTLDAQGNVVYADGFLDRIFRLNRTTGVQESVAGITPRLIGDDGPAVAALIERNGQNNTGLAVLSGGEIVYSGPRIRKIGLDGRISVIAGSGTYSGPWEDVAATETWYGSWFGLEADVEGNLYVPAGQDVLRIDPEGKLRIAAGQRDTVCGFSGDGGPAREAQMCQPFDVALDRDGNLYIADTNNNRVRRVDAKTQIITTVAGSGPVNGFERFGHGSYCGDGGPATSACINTPAGLAITPDGELVISERNSRIRKVDRNGIISTLANLSTGNFSYMTADAAGNIYVLEIERVVRITPSGSVQTLAGSNVTGFGLGGDGGPALEARVYPPGGGVAIDAEGNLLFVDNYNRRIRAVRFGAVLAALNATAEISKGSPQSAPLSTQFVDALAVQVLDSAGNPAGNVRVDFDAPEQGASCLFANQLTRISAPTDRNGIASAPCRANTIPGAFTVHATPLGMVKTLAFALTNTPPQLVSNSVTSGASFLGGAVSPGEIVVVFGAGIGPPSLVRATPGPGGFAAELAGVRLRFNGVAAPLIHARYDQIAAVTPYVLDGAASAQIQVEYSGLPSNTITVPIIPASPAIFSANSSGVGQGAILNGGGSANSAANPESRDGIIVLFCTGAGQTAPAGLDGTLATPPYPKPKLPVTVSIGGQPAEVIYEGAAPGLVAGVLQVNARVPATITPGPMVPVVLRVGGIDSPAGITAAIR